MAFAVTATDQDNDAVTITASNLPTGATFTNGNFSWTPGFDQSGSLTVSFTASDTKDQTSTSVQITVSDVIRPLGISLINPTRSLIVKNAGDTLRVSVVGESPDRGGVTYAWQINGIDQAETSNSLLFTVGEGSFDDVIGVSVSDGTESLLQSWTVTKVLLGDFNGNDSVDFPDFLIFVGAFGKTSADAEFNASADLNGNGVVDFPDFLTFVSAFGLTK